MLICAHSAGSQTVHLYLRFIASSPGQHWAFLHSIIAVTHSATTTAATGLGAGLSHCLHHTASLGHNVTPFFRIIVAEVGLPWLHALAETAGLETG